MNVQTASKAHLAVSIKWDLFQTNRPVSLEQISLNSDFIELINFTFYYRLLWQPVCSTNSLMCVGARAHSWWTPTMPRICQSPTRTAAGCFFVVVGEKISLVYLCQHWGQLCCLTLYASCHCMLTPNTFELTLPAALSKNACYYMHHLSGSSSVN